MTTEIIGTEVKVLGKTYQIKCAENQVVSLQQAGQYLEDKMREIRKTSNILNEDRLILIAALNIAHQLLTMEHDKTRDTHLISQRLVDLHSKIENLLGQSAQLEFQPAE
jgi:cell division protein ZapA